MEAPVRELEPLHTALRRLVSLAIPVIIAELGWMAMTIVDTIMVGSLGPVAIGAIGIGSNLFYTFAIFGTGLLLGLDTLVSQAFGAGNHSDCRKSLMQGIYLAIFLTPILTAFFLLLPPLFPALGVVSDVSGPAGQCLVTLPASTLPLLLYAALRRYLQAIGHVRPVMFALVSANLVNWLFNWFLIKGHWGFPALGVIGSAVSTGVARCYMALVLASVLWWFERGQPDGFFRQRRKPDWPRLQLILRIGAPAAFQILLEIGAFAAAGIMAARLNATALAAHLIALNTASVTFMVPLGTSSAAAVAVGHAVGRGQFAAARRNGWLAVFISCAFMACAAASFLIAPRAIVSIYTHNAAVVSLGASLLAVAACFQLFDGIQTVTTGVLRGVGETRIPMIVNLAGYYLLGLPVGYLLCFRYQWGVAGLWWGLTISLVTIASVLLYTWHGKSKRLLMTAETIA